MAIRKKKVINWSIYISIGALLISLGGFLVDYRMYKNSIKVQMENIVPRIQIRPIDVEERINATSMSFKVVNYGEYIANNIYIDIKIGDRHWKSSVSKAVDKDFDNKMNLSSDERKLTEVLRNNPAWDKLNPEESIKLICWDENKKYWEKQQMFFRTPDGKDLPIPPTKSSPYIRSMGWSEELDKACGGEPLRVLFRVIWENDFGRKFDIINEFELECFEINTVHTYTFSPVNVKEFN
jgi:hypothetical protein